jgi:putative NIF3 family GTP cyclohydrolase 1 type 2
MKIAEIIQLLEQTASPSYQESYDNAGLLTGNSGWDCTLQLNIFNHLLLSIS